MLKIQTLSSREPYVVVKKKKDCYFTGGYGAPPPPGAPGGILYGPEHTVSVGRRNVVPTFIPVTGLVTELNWTLHRLLTNYTRCRFLGGSWPCLRELTESNWVLGDVTQVWCPLRHEGLNAEL